MTNVVTIDDFSFADWNVFASRAARLDPDGAMRMQVVKDVLALTVAPLFPHGLGDDTPLTLGMRIVKLEDSAADGLDVVVPLRSLLDRFARPGNVAARTVPVPPDEVRVAWAGIAPPRGPWFPVSLLPSMEFSEVAGRGIAEIAEGTPEGAGRAAVESLRKRVWSRTLVLQETSEMETELTGSSAARDLEIPWAVAFAMEGLGFTDSGAEAEIRQTGSWVRISTDRGHVLTRRVN